MPGAENVVGTVVLTHTFIPWVPGKPDGTADPVTGIKTGQRQSVTSGPSGGGHGAYAFTPKPSKTRRVGMMLSTGATPPRLLQAWAPCAHGLLPSLRAHPPLRNKHTVASLAAGRIGSHCFWTMVPVRRSHKGTVVGGHVPGVFLCR